MSQINSNIKDDFQFALLLSCFVGHPVVFRTNINKTLSIRVVYIEGKRRKKKKEKKGETRRNKEKQGETRKNKEKQGETRRKKEETRRKKEEK